MVNRPARGKSSVWLDHKALWDGVAKADDSFRQGGSFVRRAFAL